MGAMGVDMRNLIYKNKILKRKKQREITSHSYASDTKIGSGYGQKFKTNKAPTSIFVGVDAPKAPTI